jgi:hypothetical protein
MPQLAPERGACEQRPRAGRKPVLAVALGALAALAGCAATPATNSAHHPSSAQELHIGDSTTVTGDRGGERMRVTLLEFMPDIAGEPNDHPEFDMQYVGAQLRLTNLGSTAYSGAPAEDVTVFTNEGQKGRRAVLSEGVCSERFALAVEIAPGHSQQGCVPAQIPVVATATRLRFLAGAGAEPAEWSLAKARTAAH